MIENKIVEAMAKAHCDFFGGEGWWDAGLLADTKPKALEAMRAAIAAMQQAQQEVIAWRYERTDGFVILVSKRYTDQHPKGDGWTETPLYAHPPVPQWQGIESAPRDGTLILVPVGHGVMDVVSWWGGAWRETANALAIRDEPTHWMPLPTPPAGGSDAE